MSGVITSLKVTEGNIFEGGDVYTIQDNENFIVTSSVDEYDISSIEKGMPAYIKTDATGDMEMTGEVTYVAIAPTSSGSSMGAVSNSASYTIKVAIDEADENIRAGMTAKISISLEESENTLTVPYDAATTILFGIVIMKNPFGTIEMLMRMIGACLIYDGLMNTMLVGRFVKSIRNFQKLEAAEAAMNSEDVIEDEMEVIEGEYKEL